MQQTDHSLLKKMNIQSDAIVVNQCDRYAFEEIEYQGHTVRYFHCRERGVGLSRNTALLRATADIVLFADDDVTYVDGYADIVASAFRQNNAADMIIFNVIGNNPDRPIPLIGQPSRVRWYNCLRYGTVRIAVRTESVRQANVHFSLLFGGGARHSAGEDNLFVFDCLRKGLRVYTDPAVIGYVDQRRSSWFEGYTDKYLMDTGVLYYHLFGRWARPFALVQLIRHRTRFGQDRSLLEALALITKGIHQCQRRRPGQRCF
ncbi:MAG: glycosyltransferase family 2 protein [Bacillota bacterium]